MGDGTAIEWADASWNPVVGCSLVSPGCTNCYAMRLAWRLASMPATRHYGETVTKKKGLAVWTGQSVRAPDIECSRDALPVELCRLPKAPSFAVEPIRKDDPAGWPLPTVWLGVSAEDQRRAEERLPALRECPAALRFLSAEPLLGPLDLPAVLGPDLAGLDWVIAGGESGPGARPIHPEWVRRLRDDCAAAGVPFFFKQWGEWICAGERRRLPGGAGPGLGRYDHHPYDLAREAVRIGKGRAGRSLDGRTHDEVPAWPA